MAFSGLVALASSKKGSRKRPNARITATTALKRRFEPRETRHDAKGPDPSALTLHGGFDANLDFPLLDSYWAPLLKSGRCQIASYTDMEPLTQGLLAHLIDFAYLPSANCYFLRHDPLLRGVVSACSPRTGKPVQSSVFVVKKSIR